MASLGAPTDAEDRSLDVTGNWTDYVQKTSGSTDLDQGRTQNEVNEITNITETTGAAWVTPVQDKNGNMTTIPKPSSLADGLTCEYDAWNRLVEVKDGETVIGRYEYDAKNRRAKRHLDTDSPADPDGLDTYGHYFYNDEWQTLETRETTTESDQPESLQPKYQYVWSPRYIDSPILRDENTDQDSTCDDDRLYYLNDANFNITTLVDSSGDATERYVYDPYGKATICDATWSNTRSTSSYDNVVFYTGRERDPETGIMHYRNRYYSTELGRFVSRDPIGHEGSEWNLHEYVESQPTGRYDPEGTSSTTVIIPCSSTFQAKCTKKCRKTGIKSITCYRNRWSLRIKCFTIRGGFDYMDCRCNPRNPKCKPCVPPVGTIGHHGPETHSHHPFKEGDVHYNLFDMQQSPYPTCRCFWHNPLTAVAVAPPGSVVMTPAQGGGPAN